MGDEAHHGESSSEGSSDDVEVSAEIGFEDAMRFMLQLKLYVPGATLPVTPTPNEPDFATLWSMLNGGCGPESDEYFDH